jgi:hypothetical protein
MDQTPPSSLAIKPMAELRRDWQLAFRGAPPPDLGRALLARAMSWKEQERLYGGYPSRVVRELKRLAQQLDRSGELHMERQMVLKPGTRLVREWNGRTPR